MTLPGAPLAAAGATSPIPALAASWAPKGSFKLFLTSGPSPKTFLIELLLKVMFEIDQTIWPTKQSSGHDGGKLFASKQR